MGGAATGGISGAASLAGLGLSAASSMLKGEGQQAADEYKAETLERHATIGRIQADQTGAALTQKLTNQLGNIDATRAAMHADPTSPTGAAIRDYTEDLGTNQKTITVDNIMEQVQQDTSDAAYMRTAGKYALLGGELGAGADVAKGLGTTDWSKFGIGAGKA